MFVSTQSKPIDYSAIQIRLNIPWKCEYVKYYISSINTKANILITNKADYLLFESTDEDIKIQFEDCYNYSIGSLTKYLNSCQSIIKFININNKIMMRIWEILGYFFSPIKNKKKKFSPIINVTIFL